MTDKRLMLYIQWYFLANTILFWIIGWRYLWAILSSETLFRNYLAGFFTWYGKLFVLIFAVVNYAGYLMLLAFVPAFVCFLLSLLISNRRFIWSMSLILFVISVLLLIMDSLIYAMFKFHLNKNIFVLLSHFKLVEVFDFSKYELLTIVCIVLGVLGLEFTLAYFFWKKIACFERLKICKKIVLSWLICFFVCYVALLETMSRTNNLLLQQTVNLPLYTSILSHVVPGKNAADMITRYCEHHYTQAIFAKDRLYYPKQIMNCQNPSKKYHIIMVMVDSLRFDSLNLKYMPNTYHFAKNNWQFLKHYSGGNSTQAGLFSLFYSIPSSYWTAALQQEIPPVFNEIVQHNGYETRAIWSSEMINPPMYKTVLLGFHDLNIQGGEGNDIGDRDRQTTQKAIQFLQSQHTKPFVLNLFYNAPHGFCDKQSFPMKYQPINENCSRLILSNDLDPKPFYNRYLNAVDFVDQEIGKVFAAIESMGYLDNSIIVFTSDHGQEFNEHQQNYWGHASNYTTVQTQVPLIIHWPGEQAQMVDYVTTHYDVLPTILQKQFLCKNPVSDYSIGQNLLRNEGRRPYIIAGSYVSMGIIEQDRLTNLLSSGDIQMTDLNAKPLPDADPRLSVLDDALHLMRTYFRQPNDSHTSANAM